MKAPERKAPEPTMRRKTMKYGSDSTVDPFK
jgi:hypothetical protein